MLSSRSKRAEEGKSPVKEHLLLTRYDAARVERGEMLRVDDVKEILAIPVLGIIPESQSVLAASNQGVPVILEEGSTAGSAYSDAVGRFLGENIDHRFTAPEKKGLFSRLFRGAA